MHLSTKGADAIKRWEGLRLKAYRPLPTDGWTIGYGHTATAHEGMEIDEARADTLFLSDVAHMERCVTQSVRVNLNQEQFDALVSFVFNVGCSAFRSSTLLKELNAGRYERVPDQLRRWVFSGGKEVGGLIARRDAEAARWNTRTAPLAANTIPDTPSGRSASEIMRSSKTVGGAGVAAVGSGTISIGAMLGEVNAITAEYTQTLGSLKSAAGENIALLTLSGVVMVAAVFIIYNRIRDSKLGRAY